MVGGGGGTSSKLKWAARKILQACGSFSPTETEAHVDRFVLDANTATLSSGPPNNTPTMKKQWKSPSQDEISEIVTEADSNATTSTNKNLCAICLDPLSYCTGSSPGQSIFTAQCSHSFHFACISSNVRHGSVTCPICRAHWTQLPRNLKKPCSLHTDQTDPILQILDDSIETFRIHRRSFLRSARYDDDDPIEPDQDPNHCRLHLSLLPVPFSHSGFHTCSPLFFESRAAVAAQYCTTNAQNNFFCASNVTAYLCVKLAHQPATDLVLVASPNGPHLRLMRQSMALVVFSLRPIDRLAIVTHTSAAARVFPLKRMTSYGKRMALQVIDRLFYMGQADPIEGLEKGVKILEDCTHKNPHSCILHLSDSPTRSYHGFDMEASIPIHRFHVGFGFGTSNGFVMHEFEEFLAGALGGSIRDIQLRIGEDGRIIRFGALQGGEERRIPLNLDESGHVCVEYSYVEGGLGECIRTGEVIVDMGDKRERGGLDIVGSIGGRTSSAESWDYHDAYMARRWAKHLHGYRF